MISKEKHDLLAKINEKQAEIDRRESRIDALYKQDPFDEKKVDRLEEMQLQACNFRNGMICAMDCVLGRGAWLEQKTPGSGEWYIKETSPF